MNSRILKNLAIMALAIASGMTSISVFAGDEEAVAGPSLYEGMGSMEGINQIVKDTIAMHLENPVISHYFEDIDLDQLIAHVTAFFAAGTGGPVNYEGRDMTSAHSALNLSVADFDSAIADVLSAVKSNTNDDEVVAGVAEILESLRPAVMGAAT